MPEESKTREWFQEVVSQEHNAVEALVAHQLNRHRRSRRPAQCLLRISLPSNARQAFSNTLCLEPDPLQDRCNGAT